MSAPAPRRYYGWDGYRLASDRLAIGVVPTPGGRIISLELDGEEILWIDKATAGQIPDPAKFGDKKKFGFGLWGGDKTWVAPQEKWVDAIPPLDLDAGAYTSKTDDHSITLTSPLCRETGLRIVRRISMPESQTVLIEQTFINESDKKVTRGIWNVTQVERPFDVYVPCPSSGIRPYPNEGASVTMRDKIVSEKSGWTRIACRAPAHFKYGGISQKGAMIAMRHYGHETLVFTRTFDAPAGAKYAHDSNVEVYNSPDYGYLEIESHAPIVEIKTGAAITHSITWCVFRMDGSPSPDEIAAMLKLF